MNFKHLSRGKKTESTCTLEEVQFGQTISVKPASLSPIIKTAYSLTTKIKNPSLENIEPTSMFNMSASSLEPAAEFFNPIQFEVYSSSFSFRSLVPKIHVTQNQVQEMEVSEPVNIGRLFMGLKGIHRCVLMGTINMHSQRKSSH